MDGGATTPLTGYYGPSPMVDLGLVFHVCGEKANDKIQANDQETWQNNQATRLGQVKSLLAVQTLPAEMKSNSQLAKAITALYLQKFVVADFSNGKRALLGMIFNHSDQALEKIETLLTYYDATGSTLTAQTFNLLQQKVGDQKTIIPAFGQKRVRMVLDSVPAGLKSASLKLISLEMAGGSDEEPRVHNQLPIESISHNNNESLSESVFKFGLGFGTPYGLLGGNMELMLHQLIGLYLGLGSMSALGVEELAYQVGMRFYLVPPEHSFRLRAGLGYGPGALFAWQTYGASNFQHYEIVDAIQPAIGFEWKLSKSFSLDFDVVYQILLKHEANYRYDGINYPLHLDDGLKIAFGVVWQFPVKN